MDMFRVHKLEEVQVQLLVYLFFRIQLDLQDQNYSLKQKRSFEQRSQCHTSYVTSSFIKGNDLLFQDLKEAQETFKQNMPAAQEEFESIMNLGREVAELGKGAENPYTIITLDVSIIFMAAYEKPTP